MCSGTPNLFPTFFSYFSRNVSRLDQEIANHKAKQLYMLALIKESKLCIYADSVTSREDGRSI